MKYVFLVFFGACCYGILSVLVKSAYEEQYTVQQVVGSQMIFGMVVLWVVTFLVAAIRKQKQGERGIHQQQTIAKRQSVVTLKQKGILMAVGTTIGLTSMLYYAALQYVPASLAIVLLFQFTWIGVLLEAVTTRTIPSKGKMISLFILWLGTWFAAGMLEESFTISWIGLGLGLLSAVSYALFIYWSGTAVTEADSLVRSTWMVTGGTVLVVIVFPPLFLIDGSLWSSLVIWGSSLAILGIVIPTLFFAIGVPKIGTGLSTILGAVELPMAVLLSAWVLQEDVGVVKWAGVIVILIGIVVPQMMEMDRGTKRSMP
ncbi:EamA family transporter [Longirhabdus pacifica]|uniref:EamA family transporter n=1 Tax=Longirhabdus pacifica TaxID=2305227 RepID=UPI001008D765|nr:DMT family transporter [Longirhabdus pacifica]